MAEKRTDGCSNYISLRGYIYNDQRYKKKKKPSGPFFLIIQGKQGERVAKEIPYTTTN